MEKIALINYTKYTDTTIYTTQTNYLIDCQESYKGKKINFIVNKIKKDYHIDKLKYLENSKEIITILLNIRRKENGKKDEKERFIW